MRYIILFLFSVCFVPNVRAQIYEVGFFLGNSNFIGDVGSTKYIAPVRPAAGLLVKWNRSTRHSFRASVLFTNLEARDKNSDDPRRVKRNYEISNTIMELSAGMEFTFWDFDLNSPYHQITPYLYTGISTARHKNYYFNTTKTSPPPGAPIRPIYENTYSWAYGIPMVLGVKTTSLEGLIIGAEIGVRYTFSDEIDGSSPDNPTRKNQHQFGNINSNDWYVFSGITLTYTFGNKPCYCFN
ncbi:DUF6089 family protein [Gelidibacter salicanalis]|uniref:DUF6089 domain-containing protein n=1 Tax=Gelidibacter salicanalis TaxID=291193 RepID=A0A934KVX9_9FLAO|nr:DUF6089 family protein [Gelidibacter salicanalis]MBJ7880360.1 hypothetical protein [Gelidibacter salicanalis]